MIKIKVGSIQNLEFVKKISTFFTLILFCATLKAQYSDSTLSISTKQLFFTANAGQWPREVLFLARMNGLNAWITKAGVVYDYYKDVVKNNSFEKENHLPFKKKEIMSSLRSGHVIEVNHELVNKNIIARGVNKLPTTFNYLKNNQSSNLVSNVETFEEVLIENIYDGIDIRWYFDKNFLRYDYLVHEGGDYKKIHLDFKGVDSIFIKENELCYNTQFGEVKHCDLKTVVNNSLVMSSWNKTTKGCSFKINSKLQKPTSEIVIDPLVFATFLGGGPAMFNEWIWDIRVDKFGNTYAAGSTTSSDFPITTGAYDSIIVEYDVYVSKFNSNCSALLFSTFIGGSGHDLCQGGFDMDDLGNIYVAGKTESPDFPTTFGGFQTTHAGFYDAFLVKLNSSGSALIYSTFIGGANGDEYSYDLVVDKFGNSYITGGTSSNDFPTSLGAFDANYAGGHIFHTDVFVTKIDASGRNLIYSTYLGGIKDDDAQSIAIDSLGNAYITGATYSSGYPVTTGSYSTIFTGGNIYSDAFVTKLNTTGTALVYSTFIGGGYGDAGISINLDSLNNAYIAGWTESLDFPTTFGAYNTTNNGTTDAFVTKLNPTGTSLIFSSFIGGSSYDACQEIKLGTDGNLYISGTTYTFATPYPVTSNAYDTSMNGENDAFISIFDPNFTTLLYSTYFGGSNDDDVFAMQLDSLNNIIIAGKTLSPDLPVTAGSYDTTYNDTTIYGTDGFVAKLSIENVMEVKEVNKNKSSFYQVYPNPNDGNFELHTDKPCTIEIIDSNGKLIETRKIENYCSSFNLKLPGGVYIIRDKKSNIAQKIIIEN